MCIRDRAYSDKVESFGLDEAWIDVSESTKLFGSGYEIATEIQKRVKDELGLSVSIGISYNKAVSYTHLDVYKRQVSGNVNGRGALAIEINHEQVLEQSRMAIVGGIYTSGSIVLELAEHDCISLVADGCGCIELCCGGQSVNAYLNVYQMSF